MWLIISGKYKYIFLKCSTRHYCILVITIPSVREVLKGAGFELLVFAACWWEMSPPLSSRGFVNCFFYALSSRQFVTCYHYDVINWSHDQIVRNFGNYSNRCARYFVGKRNERGFQRCKNQLHM